MKNEGAKLLKKKACTATVQPLWKIKGTLKAVFMVK